MTFFHPDVTNALRMLSIDAIELANSGHPGAPMGMANIAEVLWRFFLKHNPSNPNWFNRDRFILSNGHASMLLYSLLHLTGYDLSIEDLKKFRKCGSKTPGHPEIFRTPGVDITTGPLGQGLASAVGMAIAERLLSEHFNRINYPIIDHYTWVFVGDGCLMEGISHEVCSLAGTLKLNKLIVLYDSNNISIDGNVSQWFTDDTKKRFESYNWNVIEIDGHNSKEIFNAIKDAKNNTIQPSLIICKTIIGYGSPNKSGKSSSHGAPLGSQEVKLTKGLLKWKYKKFFISKKVYKIWNAQKDGLEKELFWNKLLKRYSQEYPELYKELLRRINKKLPNKFNDTFLSYIYSLQKNLKDISTREASQDTLEFLGKILPELIGGSADLSPSNLTMWSGSNSITECKVGNYIHYGVREFGMTSISNGIYHHGGFIPYSSTFLIFMEYARNAVRMAALMKTQHILIYTHDSIRLGEDGPTHQPIEQLANLRYTPNLSVWRPCDRVETAVAWFQAIKNNQFPTALVLSRQNMIQYNRSKQQVYNIERGAYILKDFGNKIDLLILSTGSEMQLAMSLAKKLYQENYQVRVVSMVSTDVFDRQSIRYRKSVLPDNIKLKISIEASVSDYWRKYIGLNGICFGIDRFGESGSESDLMDFFGFTVEKLFYKVKKFL